MNRVEEWDKSANSCFKMVMPMVLAQNFTYNKWDIISKFVSIKVTEIWSTIS